MQYFIAYVSALIVFGAVDATWLSVMGGAIYRPALGEILLPSLRIAPAIAFYAMFPIGILAFAVVPALRAENLSTAALSGLLFGAIAYGTYDLTNYATLKNWTLQITIIDVVYGAIATAIAATLSTLIARLLP